MYDIKLTYQTGNSFNSYETSDLLEVPVSNIETAKENLRRITVHYNLYRENLGYSRNPLNIVYPDFYIHASELAKGTQLHGIKLLLDDGSEHEMLCPFWTGYFEHLHSAEIVLCDPNGEFSVDF